MAVLLVAGMVGAAGAAGAGPSAASAPAGRAGTAACVDLPRAAVGAPAEAQADDRAALQTLLDAAARRSQAIGGAKLLAEAAAQDVDEIAAARKPQATLSTGLSDLGGASVGTPTSSGVQWRGGVSVSAPLYDAGRLDALVASRRQLAEAAQQSRLSVEEQVALQTVSLTLERARYGAQLQIYSQYEQKIGCLVEALNNIVSADRGRRSELVQARKSLQQVQLAREDASAQLRLVETRLQGLVGPGLPALAGRYAGLVTPPPALPLAQADAAESPDLRQLARQAEAQGSVAEATAAGQKPQASWIATGNRAVGTGLTGNNWTWSAGVQLSVPLLDPGAKSTLQAARQRAEAARLQYDDALTSRLTRIAEADVQRQAALTRATQIVDVLGNSEQVRHDTLLQWQLLGRRSLFDVMAAEGDHYGLRLSRLNALVDAEQAAAQIWSLGRGIAQGLQGAQAPQGLPAAPLPEGGAAPPR